MRSLVQALHIARAATLAEWRERRMLSSLVLLSVLSVLLIAFAVGGGEAGAREAGVPRAVHATAAAATAFWLALGLACASAVADWAVRTRPLELAFLRAGASPRAVFVGQSLALVAVLLPVAAVLLVASLSFLEAWSGAHLAWLLASVVLGCLGLAGLSVLAAGGAGGGWGAILFLALALPLLAAGVHATAASWAGAGSDRSAATGAMGAATALVWVVGLVLASGRAQTLEG